VTDSLFMGYQDLRNHGDSPHNPHHDYMTMAEDVEGFINEHKLTESTLIGHSMSVRTLPKGTRIDKM